MAAWKPTRALLLLTTIAAGGCPSDDEPADTATDGVESASGTDPTTSTTATPTSTTMDSASATSGSEASSSGGGSGSESGGSSGSGSSGAGSSSSGSGGSSGTGGGQTILDCGNQTYACGDLEDNDGDGFIDLFDPECTGPCDDDESSFSTGIPGDNMDCTQDCFFDGNSGQSEGCSWNLRCDPANPGANIGCEYTGPGGMCQNQTTEFTKECIEFCSPLTPPGCDCFGCCTVETDEGSVDIFLNGSEDCSLDNLEACEMCTSQIEECGNPCDPDGCELCFGQDELPPGCDENECDNGNSCENDGDCGDFEYCYLDCCYPLPG